MTSAKKIYLAVAGGLVAAGVVLAGIGFIVSGCDPAVFNTQIDLRDDTVVLGGFEVDDPTGSPSSSSSARWARSMSPPLRLPRRPPRHNRAPLRNATRPAMRVDGQKTRLET